MDFIIPVIPIWCTSDDGGGGDGDDLLSCLSANLPGQQMMGIYVYGDGHIYRGMTNWCESVECWGAIELHARFIISRRVAHRRAVSFSKEVELQINHSFYE